MQDHALRDPTVEELYNGPRRDQLSKEIQNMEDTDLACTFCGVSYLVFSEVQALREQVKQHQTTFAVQYISFCGMYILRIYRMFWALLVMNEMRWKVFERIP